jgi:LacI family transcriptional regulator
MAKRATVKDIAELAGVSLGAVHYALSGKDGVSNETRKRILDIARQIDYNPNPYASALKRKPLRIAAAFPSTRGNGKYFYTDVWNGLHTIFTTVKDSKARFFDIAYSSDADTKGDELSAFLESTEVDGIICEGYSDNRGQLPVNKLIEQKLPVCFITNDLPLPGRLCCVQPDYFVTGQMLAEFICGRIHKKSGILINAGDSRMPSHYLIVEGFESYIARHNLTNPVYKVHAEAGKGAMVENLTRFLKKKSIAACIAVNARGSISMAEAIIKSGRVGKLVAVGCDLFEENFQYLKEGVFSNLLNKNSYTQAYIAGKSMIDYLLWDIKPAENTIHVGSEIVFRSNAPLYESGSNRLVLNSRSSNGVKL